ncbi:MAG TPA: ribosome maturation factor RimM [Terriglobales bacterium]|nr:ribosome maturation factor RimM [Terriglobales bacterium]
MELIETGKIVSTHGVAGEVRAEAWADSLEALLDFDAFYLEGGQQFAVERSRVHRGAVNIKFAEIDSIDEAMRLIGRVIYVDRASLHLPEGTYLVRDLLGMSAVDADTGEVYGRISQVQSTGANDVYHIEAPDGRLLLVPAIPDVVVAIDLANKLLKIRPLKGLFDL